MHIDDRVIESYTYVSYTYILITIKYQYAYRCDGVIRIIHVSYTIQHESITLQVTTHIPITRCCMCPLGPISNKFE